MHWSLCPASRHRLIRVALVALVMLGSLTALPVAAQDEFDLPELDDYSGLTALTANSSDGVNLRDAPSVDGEVLAAVPVGNIVELRVDELNTVYTDDGIRWWPVTAWGVDGWIAGMYLADADGATDEPAAPAEASFTAGDQVRVATEDGGLLAMREGPGTGNSRVAWLGDGDVVEVVDGPFYNGNSVWYLVTDGAIEAYVFGGYLSIDVASDDDEPADDPVAAAEFAAGDYVAAATEDGGNLAMRIGPGTSESRIAWLGDGDVVQVIDGPIYNQSSAWYLVTDGSIEAYVFGGYLTASTSDGPSVEVPDLPVRFGAGDIVGPVDGSGGVNIRTRVSANSGHISTLREGQAVRVIDGPYYDRNDDDWYLVDLGNGDEGYIWGAALEVAPEANLRRAEPEPEPEPEAQPPAQPTGPTGSLRSPLASYTLTQSFGCSPFSWNAYDANLGCPYHNGLDMATSLGTPLLAADGGTVLFAGWCDCGLGYYVEIDHGNGLTTVYGHMNALYVSTGQRLDQGDVIGEIGSTGFSTGPHVHFMVKVNGVPVDPFGYIS